MSQNYGQHSGHRDYIRIRNGVSMKNSPALPNSYNKAYIKDINDDEAMLVAKEDL